MSVSHALVLENGTQYFLDNFYTRGVGDREKIKIVDTLRKNKKGHSKEITNKRLKKSASVSRRKGDILVEKLHDKRVIVIDISLQ